MLKLSPTLAGWMRRAICAFLLSLIALILPGSQAQTGARTVARSLDQLTKEADVIVHGYVTSVKLEPHPQLRNLTTTVVSIDVKDIYKGKPRKSIVFRQYVWDIVPHRNASEYSKGEELVLLLGPVSEYGLTSPVGLEQGRFRVYTDSRGQTVTVNGRGNRDLFRSVLERANAQGIQLSPRTAAMASHGQGGPVPLADLGDAIRTFAGTR